jgi:Ni/Co efflux regulator RcnB
MKKLLASLVALTFLAVSGLAAAQDKKQEKKEEKKEEKTEMKGGKPAAAASKTKADKTAKAPKKKKEGC